MDTFSQLVGSTRKINVGGKAYTLSLIDFADIAELRRRVLHRRMERSRAFLETPEERVLFARQVMHELFSDAEFQAELLLTLEGQIDLLELSLRHEQPDLTTAEVAKLFVGKNRNRFTKELVEVFRDSVGPIGVPAGDEKSPDPPAESPSSPPRPS